MTDAQSHSLTAAEDAPRLDVFLSAQLDISRNQAATLITLGHVLVEGRREKASYKARTGEIITVEVPQSSGREVIGEDIPLTIAY
jgi:23S rRNA pseudouridine1911/1915/1917 synthase